MSPATSAAAQGGVQEVASPRYLVTGAGSGHRVSAAASPAPLAAAGPFHVQTLLPRDGP